MMLGLLFSSPLAFVIIFGGLLLSVTLHEFAHCWVADRLGDPTPRSKGRLTLDPRAHLDPLGTLMILVANFGWGKPAPFDPYNLKNPVRDTALIAAAGPITNLAIALLLAGLIQLGLLPLALLGSVMAINIMLAVFNLVPIYPLDGSKILTALLPRETAMEYESVMTRYGMLILLFLIFPWNGVSPVSQLLSPVINMILGVLI
jgi:Zn-dependent protease